MKSNPSRALIVAVSLNVILAAALIFVWRRSLQPTVSEAGKSDSSQMTAANSGSAKNSDNPSSDSMPAGVGGGNEPTLAPVQLTSQRMQTIGVKLGIAQMKVVSNDIRVTGNVDINERQLATVPNPLQ